MSQYLCPRRDDASISVVFKFAFYLLEFRSAIMRFSNALNQIKRITLRETESENLVLFFPWLGAKEKHFEKYVSKLYGMLYSI